MKLGSFNTVTDASGYYIPLVKPNEENAKISEEDFINNLPSTIPFVTNQEEFDAAVSEGAKDVFIDTTDTISVMGIGYRITLRGNELNLNTDGSEISVYCKKLNISGSDCSIIRRKHIRTKNDIRV